jgi:hypothetical protein
MIYGDRKFTTELQALNPGLNRANALSPEQVVYFDSSKLNPQMNYVTKDFLERYSDALSASLGRVNAPRAATSVGSGETLQAVSQRLYGTTRYWTELYLLNKEKISGYDKVKAGTELSYIQHDQITQIASAAPKENNNNVNNNLAPANEAVPAETLDSQTANQLQPSAEPSGGEVIASGADNNSVLQPPAAIAPMSTQLNKVNEPQKTSFWTAANIRKAVYILLVAAVIGIAFVMTRGGSKRYSSNAEEQRKVI